MDDMICVRLDPEHCDDSVGIAEQRDNTVIVQTADVDPCPILIDMSDTDQSIETEARALLSNARPISGTNNTDRCSSESYGRACPTDTSSQDWTIWTQKTMEDILVCFARKADDLGQGRLESPIITLPTSESTIQSHQSEVAACKAEFEDITSKLRARISCSTTHERRQQHYGTIHWALNQYIAAMRTRLEWQDAHRAVVVAEASDLADASAMCCAGVWSAASWVLYKMNNVSLHIESLEGRYSSYVHWFGQQRWDDEESPECSVDRGATVALVSEYLKFIDNSEMGSALKEKDATFVEVMRGHLLLNPEDAFTLAWVTACIQDSLTSIDDSVPSTGTTALDTLATFDRNLATNENDLRNLSLDVLHATRVPKEGGTAGSRVRPDLPTKSTKKCNDDDSPAKKHKCRFTDPALTLAMSAKVCRLSDRHQETLCRMQEILKCETSAARTKTKEVGLSEALGASIKWAECFAHTRTAIEDNARVLKSQLRTWSSWIDGNIAQARKALFICPVVSSSGGNDFLADAQMELVEMDASVQRYATACKRLASAEMSLVMVTAVDNLLKSCRRVSPPS